MACLNLKTLLKIKVWVIGDIIFDKWTINSNFCLLIKSPHKWAIKFACLCYPSTLSGQQSPEFFWPSCISPWCPGWPWCWPLMGLFFNIMLVFMKPHWASHPSLLLHSIRKERVEGYWRHANFIAHLWAFLLTNKTWPIIVVLSDMMSPIPQTLIFKSVFKFKHAIASTSLCLNLPS